MNTALKHWKEAATLILVAGQRPVSDGFSRTARSVACAHLGSSHGQSHLPHKSSFDYDVLMLKRSSKSGFMPNAYVFPGGLVDSSDFSSEWLDIFKHARNSPNYGLASVRQPLDTRPPIFATDRQKLGSPIPGEVAFRICALRETFEESGVLLVVPKPGETSFFTGTDLRCATNNNVSGLCSKELVKWRALVNRNPSNFVRMCRELEVVPNIWALREWSNWLTPKARPGSRRYNTAFFICCLQDVPVSLQDGKEIVRVQWSAPSEVLQNFHAKEFWIAPPQFYELSRMCRLPLLSDLHEFSIQRAREGCEQWMPVVVQDGQLMSLLPGDGLYPLSTSEEAKEDKGTDLQQEDPLNCGLHRILFLDSYNLNIQITITPKHNHLVPVVGPAIPRDLSSKC
ncbi:acyl-coenzyme A diphosphatase NUDT19 [Brachionichthys hirsutus]|uniref:acyl-coenzyme A diphosphatase NUDT19 n=1 Tax=Brachionichthys hirsutus TaxID=412623 RepID=UPI00360491BC